MEKLNIKDIVKYVENNIGEFHKRRLESLNNFELLELLKKKNPYLHKAKNVLTAESLIKAFLDAHLSSQEETIFGEFLEGLAIFVCGKTFMGKKSAAEGIDLEFEREDIKYIVTIKSGTNWGNGDQIQKMKLNFRRAKKVLGTSSIKTNVVAVNGCCYGRVTKIDKGEYLKIAGQRFWEFISGDELLYLKIIEPLGHKAKEKNEEFQKSYARIINKFTYEFITKFCLDGVIDWEKLTKYNSAIEILKI